MAGIESSDTGTGVRAFSGTAIIGFIAVAAAQASEGPVPAAATPPIAAPEDKPYPGVIHLAVDTSDLDRRVYRIHETIPVPESGGDIVLDYPKWLPGTHAPAGPIARLAGLEIAAKGKPVAWMRDAVDVYAFHVAVPPGTAALDLDFEYLSAVDLDGDGRPEVTPAMLILEWNAAILYPAGYYSRQIPVEATLTLPAGWQFGTALEPAGTNGATTGFKRVSLETLVDSPVYAGKYTARLDLDPSGPVPVHLDLFADRADFLAIRPEQLDQHRALVQQAYKLFGGHHYDHYDFLLSLSDKLESQGTEHHRSSEDGAEPTHFTEWDKEPAGRDLLAHEFTHSWNGKFRRPADLWTANFNVPMRDSLLWVYEGQTQYWGQVLTARAGMLSKQQALDQLAGIAAYFQILPGRAWRPLEDTTSDEIINPRRPMPWRTWQRFEDYYAEGLLVWLDADTLIRERSHGQRSLDDFAHRFFGIDGDSWVPVTYTFEDIVAGLNAVEPYDWAGFLKARLTRLDVAPLDGITRGGYQLVYTEEPGDYLKQVETQRKVTGLLYSIGVEIDHDGVLKSVLWGGPAYKAGLVAGAKIIAVNGAAYDTDAMKAAVRDTKTSTQPLQLIVKDAARYRVIDLDYHGGARYPHLVRNPAEPARLDDILAAKP